METQGMPYIEKAVQYVEIASFSKHHANGTVEDINHMRCVMFGTPCQVLGACLCL